MVKIQKRSGHFDLLHPDRKKEVIAIVFPDDAPFNRVSATWKYGEAPDSDYPPSEMVEFISERVERPLISSGRDEKREKIEWIREHADEMDALWAKNEIKQLRKDISRKKETVERLRCQYDAGVEKEVSCELVFQDWVDKDGESVYNTEGGMDLSTGNLHSGTCFRGTIRVDSFDAVLLESARKRDIFPVFELRRDDA